MRLIMGKINFKHCLSLFSLVMDENPQDDKGRLGTPTNHQSTGVLNTARLD